MNTITGLGQSIDQYYNLYDPEKGYTNLLYRAGKVLQSKELNEMESIIKGIIQNVGDTILTDGDVIEGCQLVIDIGNKKATITSGRIYLEGNVRIVNDTVIDIEGQGTEIIGVVLESEVITPDDDKDLLDVASGYDNYNQDGAYRLREYVRFTVNDPEASIMYTLQDGQQMSLNTSEDLTQLEKMQATLARRTFDESGNYKVYGLTIVDKNYCDETNIYVSVEAGKAYVQGYEVEKPVPVTIPLSRAGDLRTVENEPKIYESGNNQYILNNDYINAIIKLVGIIQEQHNLTRSSIIGGIDPLPLTPVVKVVSVSQSGKTFVQGVDYKLTSDGIDWSLGKDAPSPGSTYTVVWQYNKTMIRGTDYTLYKQPGTTKGYIEFLTDGDKPVPDSTFLVNYNFGLCRRDNIAISKTGAIIVTPGQSDIMRLVESPAIDNTNVLTLGSVLVRPDSDTVEIINNNTKTISMLSLYNMLRRINELEYNQSINDLDQEAAEGELATQLAGIFTDGFIGMSKADVSHPEWTASIDLDNEELTVPFTTYLSNMIIDENDNNSIGRFGRLITAPYTEVNLLSQNAATSAFRINSYNAFPKTPVVTLDPEIDTWINETTVKVDQVVTKTATLRRWWYHKNEAWAAEEKRKWQEMGFADGGESLGWSNGTISHEVTETLLDEADLYMRVRNINVTINSLEPSVDNITGTFDGKPISLYPLTDTNRGTTAGTLRANARGTASGYFTIPDNTLCGTRELLVWPANMPSLVGAANYTASGRTITKKVFTERITVTASDPLAQSFQFDQDQFITAVGIYFNDKDINEPVTVQLRNMVNGYPGNTIYAEKVIDGTTVRVSTDATQETKVVFDNPAYCLANEQYCFTVLSNSDIDSIWIAETGAVDVRTGAQVAKNPYLAGTMFSSSNALTWTAHQSQDVKFNIYGAQFQTNGHAAFETVVALDKQFDRVMVVSEESIPAGCSVQWQYRINGEDWLPIETYDDRELSELADTVQMRVVLKATSNTSPAIALDGLMTVGFSNELSGVYVSRNVFVQEGFNNIKQVIDLHLPIGTNATMYYATDADGNNWTALSSSSQVQKSIQYTTYTFEKDLEGTYYNYRCKIELTTSNQLHRPTAQALRNIMKVV